MYEIKQSVVTKIPVKLVSAVDTTVPLTGVASPTIYYSKNGGSATSLSSSQWASVTNMPGLYMITPTAAMIDTPGPLVVSVEAANAVPSIVVVSVVANTAADNYTLNLLVRKLLTNKTADNGTTVTVYDDDSTTVLGTFTWNNTTGVRGKLT